jgi:hypothetical protein
MLDLMTPDAFAGDAYGWITNQLSHAFIGLIITALVAGLLDLIASDWIEDRGMMAWVLVLTGYAFGWEMAVQHLGGGALDAIADTFFVAMGGLIGLAAWWRKPALLAAGFILTAGAAVAGVWRRK